MTYALSARGLSKRWGSFVANDGIDLDLPRGVRHALIGPNGAGKTTLINLLCGVFPPSAGEILLGGERITHLPQQRRVKRGLTRTFQVNSLFWGLSVLESVVLALCERNGRAASWLRAVASHRSEHDEARALLAELGLETAAHTPTKHLPYGKQRLVEIALGLATKPEVLILDEPTAGISIAESVELFEVIAHLPEAVTVLFVEHDMELVFRFAQRISVLHEGRVLCEGDPAEIAADARVREIYLGEAQRG
jgi:branched-chain amino acid transport system ATP-binding protein